MSKNYKLPQNFIFLPLKTHFSIDYESCFWIDISLSFYFNFWMDLEMLRKSFPGPNFLSVDYYLNWNRLNHMGLMQLICKALEIGSDFNRASTKSDLCFRSFENNYKLAGKAKIIIPNYILVWFHSDSKSLKKYPIFYRYIKISSKLVQNAQVYKFDTISFSKV